MGTRVEARQDVAFPAVARTADNQVEVNVHGYEAAKLVVDLATPPAGLGSEVTTVGIGGATGGTFTLTYDGNVSTAIAFDETAIALDTIIQAITGVTASTVTGGGTLVKEVVTIDIATATSGSFTITADGETTFPIEFDAANTAVKSALEKLPTVAACTVTGTGASGTPWIITFDDPIQNIVVTTDDTLLVGDTLNVVGTTAGVAAVDWVITIDTPQQNFVVTGDGALLTGGIDSTLSVVETTPGQVGGGTVTFGVWFNDEASGNDLLLLQAVAMSTASTVELDIGPETVAAANLAAQEYLPEILIVKAVHSVADEQVYSVGVHRYIKLR